MEQSGFFDANLVEGEYDRVYLAETFAKYFASFIGNGVFGGKLDALQITATTNPSMNIVVKTGQGWIDGYWYENSTELSLPIELAHGVLNRKDSVVLRISYSDRNMKCYVKTGTPAINPVAPVLQRDADVYELQLAIVNVNNGVLNIKQVNIQDTRGINEVCGFVTGLIKQIDTTEYIGQLQNFINDYIQSANDQFGNFKGNLADIENQAKAMYATFVDEVQDMIARSENEFSSFLVWLNNTKTNATDEIQRLLDALEGLLDGEVAAVLSEKIRALEEQEPTEELGTIEHSLNKYPDCQLFEYNFGTGVQGAGEGPAGGETLISIPTHFEMTNKNEILVKTKIGYGVVEEINKITDRTFAIVFTDKTKSVIAFLRG